jgi:hypothetical protein
MSGRIESLLPLLLLAACGSSSKAAGAAALVSWGMLGSAVSRSQGGCYAVCDARQFCNPENGLCEDNPCGLGCGPGQRCDLHTPMPRCVDAALPTDLVRSPPPPPSLPVAAPPP